MNNSISNVASVYESENQQNILASASTNFNVVNQALTMTKTVDRGNGYYSSGDSIIFTIIITNNTDTLISGLFFKDDINQIVLPTSTNGYSVTTTSGIITSTNNSVNINDISVGANSTVTITITGIIA